MRQGCYVFKPTTPEDEAIDPRPSKKRKLNKASQPKSIEHHHDVWPRLLGGQESEEAAVLRQKLFESTWAKQQAKLDKIAHPFDEQLVGDILEWRSHKSTDQSLYGREKLRTCILVSPPGTQTEFHKLWEGELRSSNDQTEIVVHLQPSQCPNLQTSLKNVIKSAITSYKDIDEYSDFLTQHKALVPMNFDLELLQRYVKLHDVDRVLISIMEVEAFDTAILSELVSTLHSWSNRIPFVLFIGISTTVELFETRLSRATVSLLDATVFATSGGGEDFLFKVYNTLQLAEEEEDTTQVFLGPPIVDTLAELAEDQSTTPETIIYAIKYVYMSHFFANPLSILLVPTDDEELPPWNDAFSQAIRNLPSFKSHCEALAKGDKSQRQKVRQILTSDKALQTEVKETMLSGRQVMRSSPDAIFTLRYIYHNVHQLDRYSPWESEVQLLSSLPDLIDTEIFDAIVEATNAPLSTAISEASTMQILNESSEPGLDAFKSFCASKSQELDADADEDDFLTLLRLYLQELRTKISSAQPSPTSTTTMTNPFRHFLAESYTVTSKSPISQILHPRSRYSLERALTRPADYLGCPCCSINSNSSSTLAELDKSTFPPTSLLLGMLNEAGAIINVRDLWDAFRDSLTSQERDRDGESDADANADEGDDEDDKDGNAEERHILALFYRALAELRYLGLVKASKRRPAPGVECIQKTAWMGL